MPGVRGPSFFAGQAHNSEPTTTPIRMAEDHITPVLHAGDLEDSKIEHSRHRTLGNVRLRHHETSEIILVPTPSNDPNDPLNW